MEHCIVCDQDYKNLKQHQRNTIKHKKNSILCIQRYFQKVIIYKTNVFEPLPNNVILNIISYMNVISILNFMLTCKNIIIVNKEREKFWKSVFKKKYESTEKLWKNKTWQFNCSQKYMIDKTVNIRTNINGHVRKTFTYYRKKYKIPKVGDVVNFYVDDEFYYVLCCKVTTNIKSKLYIKGVMLKDFVPNLSILKFTKHVVYYNFIEDRKMNFVKYCIGNLL